MTRPMTQRYLPRAIVTSTVGTILTSVMAAWLVTSTMFVPTLATQDDTIVAPDAVHQPSDRPLYRLSPIPPGADWTA